MKKIIFLIVLLFNTFLSANITVQSSVDTAFATIGDQITLTISVRYPNNNTTIAFPKINDEFQNLSLIRQWDNRKEKISTGYQKDHFIKLAVFDTGAVKIPPVTVTTQADTGQKMTFQTAEHRINVVSVLPPDEKVQPKDIKPPFPLPRLIHWDVLLFLTLLLVLFTAWYFWYKRWRRKHPAVNYEEKILDPPHVIALKKLSAIKDLPFQTEAEKIKVYTKISRIFREYLERRFFIHALEMSTRDILDKQEVLEIDSELMPKIEELLKSLDIIKFGNQLPDHDDRNQRIELTKQLINATKVDDFLSQRSGLTEAKEQLTQQT